MIKLDLERAGIPYPDGSGNVADFHCLRHTFISRLARSRVSPAVAKSLARHSTITLTIDRYTHTLIQDERRALDLLPRIRTDPEAVPMQATGTTNETPKVAAHLQRARPVKTCHYLAISKSRELMELPKLKPPTKCKEPAISTLPVILHHHLPTAQK